MPLIYARRPLFDLVRQCAKEQLSPSLLSSDKPKSNASDTIAEALKVLRCCAQICFTNGRGRDRRREREGEREKGERWAGLN